MLGAGQAAMADALQHAIAPPRPQEMGADDAAQGVRSAEDAVAALLARAEPPQVLTIAY